MSFTRRTLVGLALVAPFAVAAPVSAADAIKLGYQLPLTGNTAQYGQDFKTAAEIALERFNASGRLPVKVEIVFEDSRSDAKEGVAIARMRIADRDAPAGKVLKWHRGGWSQPGLGGRLTPIWPSRIDWHRPNADLFWGPSVHWNTHLNTFVILMNRAVTTGMKGDGTWVSFNDELANPSGWSEPAQILTAAQAQTAAKGANKGNAANFGWYPQVVGTARGESDRLAGKTARYFVAGVSNKVIVFLRPGEKK